MKHVKTFENFQDSKNFYVTEPLNEKIDLAKLFKGKSKEEKRKIALDIIKSHPTKAKLYNKLKKESGEKADKFVEFVMKKPYVVYFKWDDKKGEFVDTGNYSSTSIQR